MFQLDHTEKGQKGLWATQNGRFLVKRGYKRWQLTIKFALSTCSDLRWWFPVLLHTAGIPDVPNGHIGSNSKVPRLLKAALGQSLLRLKGSLGIARPWRSDGWTSWTSLQLSPQLPPPLQNTARFPKETCGFRPHSHPQLGRAGQVDPHTGGATTEKWFVEIHSCPIFTWRSL